jgi:hypothetical protein
MMPEHEIAAVAAAGDVSQSCNHEDGVRLAQAATYNRSAPSATTACTAWPAADDQHRPALALLGSWAGGNVSTLSGQHAAADPSEGHGAPAGMPQAIRQHACAAAAAAATAEQDHDEDVEALDAGSSPTLIDVDTTTGGIQLHRCGRGISEDPG